MSSDPDRQRVARAHWLPCTLNLFLAVQVASAQELPERLQPLIDAHEGRVAVAVRHLDTGASFLHQAGEPMPTASLIKLPVMVEAYRQAEAGQLDLAQSLTLRESDKVPGSGILTKHFSEGACFSVRDAIRLMIAASDNTATNLVVARIGLPATAEGMERLGLPNTRLHSFVYRRETSIFPDRSRQFGLGSTTAAEMVHLLEWLYTRKLVSHAASEAMLEHLLACEDKLKFPRLLPVGTKVAHKTGSVEAARTAAGIIETPRGPVALCVLTAQNKDIRWTDDNAGDLLCARIAREVFDHFAGAAPQDSPPEGRCGPDENNPADEDAVEPRGAAEGPEVGDTEEAGAILPVRGEASSNIPSRQPRDSLSGPPFVSCRQWVVADARTGSLVGDSGGALAVDVASTTKIMTAHVILQLVAENPSWLEGDVAFSERAARTSGSSCDLKAGETLPVKEMLFALLLPSGNDAAIALAEHFGPRCAPLSDKSDGDSVARFVAEMNRAARRLELSATRYRNPNGLPEKGHVSSARDLARLTAAAWKSPLFREIVATRRFEAQVRQSTGERRTVAWKNTNRLLAVSGYNGVKTGYTKGAGSCLVSTGERGKDELIVVVLGAPSAAAAVADSRNLYRWAWRERGHRE